VINGQKVWTSGAHYSDYGIIITRTDPNVPKHAGLTMFFLSMKDAGRRGAADQADVGRRQLQRGVLHRRAHPRQPAAGQGGRGLEGAPHDA
jgi:alkylation response protein AidB-like acyl-CoA dehydrogenase